MIGFPNDPQQDNYQPEAPGASDPQPAPGFIRRVWDDAVGSVDEHAHEMEETPPHEPPHSPTGREL